MNAYIVIVILLLTAAVIIWSKVLEFFHYDYRKNERNDYQDLPTAKPDNANEDRLPRPETDDWIEDWVYDPETKSFKKK